MTGPAKPEATPDVPIFQESIAGSLIDAARISVMAALFLMPPLAQPLIFVPGEDVNPAGTPQDCLEQAMQWLDAARVLTIEAGAPVTSLHVAGARG